MMLSPPSQSSRMLPAYGNCGYLEGPRQTRRHTHDEPQLIAIIEGNSIVEANGRTIGVHSGEAFVVPPHTEHLFRTLEPCLAYFVRFRPAGTTFDSSLRTIRIGEDPWLLRWFEDLHRLKKTMAEGAGELADGVLHSLLTRITQIEREHQGPAVHPALRRAVRVIEDDLAAPMTVGSLAFEAAVSPSYLTSLFRRRLGCGPMQYLTSLRLSLAVRQLQDPDLSIKEIGYLCGFSDPNYFARVFRKRYRCSPSEYRRRIMGSEAPPP